MRKFEYFSPNDPELPEVLALAILNSDREQGGLKPVQSRENIINSDGYLHNAHSVITALTHRYRWTNNA